MKTLKWIGNNNKTLYTMRKLLLFVFAIVAFAACEQAPIEEQSAIRTDAPETIRVGFEDDETRIQLNSAQKTVWTKGDLVSVFYRSDANQKWQYQGESGERVGDLKRVDAGTATESTKRVVVVYPYNENYYINTETYNVQATLPATQHYLANSYGTDGNIMVSSSEYNQFSLKSVCGWLKLQLTGDGEVVKSIKFRGNDGEQVAGELYINSADATAMLASDMGSSDDNNAGGNLVFDDTILTEVVLDCGEGVTLGKSATAFYIALPPQTFANGFTVEIEDADGYAMEQSTAKTFVVERNTIQPMAAINFVNPDTPAQPTPANNQIWYTATKKAEPNYTDKYAFGADVISNTWDSETGKGIITFDGNVTMVGYQAFINCDNFITINLPDSVTTIGENAFRDCNSLTSVNIPESVTTIGENAFRDCNSLTSVTIPESVTTIGYDAFYNCSSLTSVTIPDSVTTIGEYAFFNCIRLTSVNIPESVTTIGKGAFSRCYSLTSVNIPESVTTIGEGTFANCTKLREFTGKYAADGGRCLIIDNTIIAYAEASGTTYNIPDSVTSIGSRAFFGCNSLTSVNIPNSVKTIGEDAFYECSSLTSITIPDSVTTIGYAAFSNCYSLTSVTIGNSVTKIGEYAFIHCGSLKYVYCKSTTPPALGGSDVFYNNASGRRIIVPIGSGEAYKKANRWSEYANYIFEDEF